MRATFELIEFASSHWVIGTVVESDRRVPGERFIAGVSTDLESAEKALERFRSEVSA